MEEKYLDMVMVPLGLLLQATYHIWLFFTIVRHPNRTVIGVNAQVKHRWLRAIMADPLGNGTLAVQTLRNDIMASTALATTAVTLASLISVFVSATTSTATSSLVYGNTSSVSVRYHTHASFLMSQPVAGPVSPEHAARSLDRGSLFWSLGLRAFYVSFTLFLWVFGPIPMLASSVVMCCLLFFLDTTTELPRAFHLSSFTVEEDVKEEV
ncbi:hypothetical protein MUK42_31276 [Musa troglodytarum]|uniref:Uncharacterized protein n=1 Tax=Musa troglodytarum TaxID=320322 RepID=A0A9E7FLC9_9LILI|nr:hypothetical protein MUK42_31276 [Musa troglodytarum]